jgi:hypothetical protein
MKRFVIRLSCWFALAGLIGASSPRETRATGPVGVLLDTPADRLGPEARAAWELAGRLGPSARVVTSSEGRFRDENGHEVALDSFPVLWFHQGDSGTATGPAYSPITIVKLRRYVSEGHGLLLSGAALGMVRPLGLEPFSPRRAGPGVGFFLAGLVPTDPGHPAFQGLSGSTGWGDSTFLCNDSGYAAFSDFEGKRALSGMVLARANSSSENPLVEYELGRGRVIVLGWRVPRYAYPSNPHRANLERLTGNLLGYLGTRGAWRKVVVRNDSGALADASPGVPEARWTSLELAIRDLTATFKERYAKGPEFLARLSALKTEHDALRKGPLDKDHLAGLDRIAAAFDAARTTWAFPPTGKATRASSRPASTTACASSRRCDPAAPRPRSSSPLAAGSWATSSCTGTPTACSSPCPARTAAGRSTSWVSTARISTRSP